MGKRQSQRRIDRPMAGPFLSLPFSEGKGLGNEVELVAVGVLMHPRYSSATWADRDTLTAGE